MRAASALTNFCFEAPFAAQRDEGMTAPCPNYSFGMADEWSWTYLR